ncbi:MAG TPA: pyridine nucleotide-disulfide oxidoreductase, partial [Pseudomonas sp.]|nr:pyridine nucleotide-disulfide oxidoreductase [Pseudomonas sp.]
MNSRKLVLLALILAAIAGFFVLDLGQYLDLERLKAQQTALNAQVAANPWQAAGLFGLAYVAVTALSLPGAALMTLLAGALFGLFEGFVLVSFASTLGATLAMLSSRFLLRDWVQGRFGQRLAGIDKGIEREGAF